METVIGKGIGFCLVWDEGREREREVGCREIKVGESCRE